MAIKGDFISFTYNGVHSTELGVMRVTSSNRYTDALLPTIQDKAVQAPGSNGTYFFGSYYTQRPITINVAFDEVSESQIRLMRKTFGDGLSHELIFDDEPYKVYYAKATGTPQLQYIPFSTPRIYKGEGTFTFTCYDPFAHCKNSQKYLNEFPDTTTDVEMNGNIVGFNSGVGNLKKVEVEIEPMQSGSGDPSPSNVRPITGYTGANIMRTGKNLLKNRLSGSGEKNSLTYVVNADGSITVNGTADGTSSLPNILVPADKEKVSAGSYILNGCPEGGASDTYRLVLKKGTTYYVDTGSGAAFTINQGENYEVYIRYNSGTVFNNLTFKPMIRLATETDDTYEPYTGDIYIADWTSTAGTVYSGSYDAVSGKLKARPQYASYNGEVLVGPWLSSMDKYQAGATPTIGAQVVDLGGVGTEYMLAPQEISTLVGQNYIWSNLGTNIDVVYKKVIGTTEYFKLEWNPSAQLLESKGTYDTYNSSTGFKLYNPGDVETDFKFIIPITNLLRGIKINDGVNDLASYTLLINAPTAKTGDSYLCFNSKLNLIEGLNSSKQRTGTVYNEYINSGSWFKIPLNRTGTNWYFKPIFSSTYSGTAPILEYDYLYF